MTPTQNKTLDAAQALVPELEEDLRFATATLRGGTVVVDNHLLQTLIAALQLLPALRKENEGLRDGTHVEAVAMAIYGTLWGKWRPAWIENWTDRSYDKHDKDTTYEIAHAAIRAMLAALGDK